eukprot:Plantae.Rhodophyta-Hildenbrandia_rubra.ctg8755.p1 GENE.Plantae.Rhodophyta-Hildenbrandia_rubra.ctg8755~~Plantae.Rhodophyta-Hildenbrandia_rubra.ctg8755.p1  ORF type:complete len:429 (+),score=70.67 Plantae.Rhodophyta-Hildenbrandia_rubra.ctg8755:274-1560(+)
MQGHAHAQQNAKESRRRHQEKLMEKFFDTPAAPSGNPYKLLKYIGEGAYGVVMMAQDKRTGENVAVKRIVRVVDTPAMAIRILRELKLLRLLSAHDNIIKVKDVLIPEDPRRFNDVFVVFELMPVDLSKLLRTTQELRPDYIKYFMFQILSGVHFMHSAGVFHRDLKPNNIMINGKCKLRIIDLGLARARFQNDMDTHFWTDYVATRWYRAPELIMKEDRNHYSTAIDMWSVGCIFAEILMRGHVLFPGRNVPKQFELITDLLGTPTPELLAKLGCSDRWIMYGRKRPRPLRDLFPGADPLAVSLIEQILVFDPDQRLSALEALQHPYFAEYLHLGLGAECDVLSSDEFLFERHKLTPQQMREEFIKEILHYHPEMTMEMVCGSSNMSTHFNDALRGNRRRETYSQGSIPTTRYEHMYRQATESQIPR